MADHTEAELRVAANLSLQEEIHRLHRMIHTLRNEAVSEMSDEEIDRLAGVEPQCAACHGYGPGSGQVPLKDRVKVVIDGSSGSVLRVFAGERLPPGEYSGTFTVTNGVLSAGAFDHRYVDRPSDEDTSI